MSEYNQGQAEQAAIWGANLDASNGRVDSGAYSSNYIYRHEHDRRTEELRPVPEVYVPQLWPSATGTAVVSTGNSGSSRSASSGEDDGAVWAGIAGVVGIFLAIPLIAWAFGVLASRVLPWPYGVLEIGHVTGWFGPNGWLVAALFVIALAGQWLVAAVAMQDAKDPVAAFLMVALTLFAATEAVKAILMFAHAPDFQCRSHFAWVSQACSADVWSFAKSAVSWTGIAAMTGLAAWAVTVVTALVYVAFGTVLQALVVAPAIVIMGALE